MPSGTTKSASSKGQQPLVDRTPLHARKLADLRKLLNLSQAKFAPLVPVSVRTLATLESGKKPTGTTIRRLVELERLTRALSEVMRLETIGDWLQTPNQAFDGLKPTEVIDRGEADRVWGMIYHLRSGTAF